MGIADVESRIIPMNLVWDQCGVRDNHKTISELELLALKRFRDRKESVIRSLMKLTGKGRNVVLEAIIVYDIYPISRPIIALTEYHDRIRITNNYDFDE